MNGHDEASVAWSGVDDDVLTIDTENTPNRDGQRGSTSPQEIFEEEKREVKGNYFYEEEDSEGVTTTPNLNASKLSTRSSSITVPISNQRQNATANSKSIASNVDENPAVKPDDAVDSTDPPCCEMQCGGRRVAPCFCCLLVVGALLSVAAAAFGGSVLAYYSTEVWNWSWPWNESESESASTEDSTETLSPVEVLIQQPSPLPTVTKTMQPTLATSMAVRRASITARFIDVNKGEGGGAIDRAIEWVAVQDSAQRSVTDPQLIQRIVLASMALEWPVSAWLTDSHECEWEGIGCDENDIVQALNLPAQSLSSTIPNSMDLLTGLRSVDLSSNKLTGRLPGLANTRELMLWNVANNTLDGGFPEEMYSLQSLVDFRVSFNSISGNLPGWIGRWTDLKVLDLSFNQFSGALPTTIGELSILEVFDVSVNNLVGTLPLQLFQLTALREVSVRTNQLTGPLPNEVTLLTDLQHLDVAFNSLNGTIPSLSSLPALTSLNVEGNNFALRDGS